MVCWYRSQATRLDLDVIAGETTADLRCIDTTQGILDVLVDEVQAGDHVVIMSNGGFEGLHQRLLALLESGLSRAAG